MNSKIFLLTLLLIISIPLYGSAETCQLFFQQNKLFPKKLFADYLNYPQLNALMLVREDLASAESLLDIGTGTGRNITLLHRLAPKAHISGIELLKKSLELAEKQIQILSDPTFDLDSLSVHELRGLAVALENLGVSYTSYLDLEVFRGRNHALNQYLEGKPFYDLPPVKDILSFNNNVTALREGLKLVNRNKLLATDRVSLQQGNATKLPYPDNSFDFVYMNDVLVHLDGQQAALAIKEAMRVTRKKLVFTNYMRVDVSHLERANHGMYLSLAEIFAKLRRTILSRKVELGILPIEVYDTSFYEIKNYVNSSFEKVDIGQVYREAQGLPEEQFSEIVHKYYLAEQGFMWTHAQDFILDILGRQNTEVRAAGGGEMFTAIRELYVWKK